MRKSFNKQIHIFFTLKVGKNKKIKTYMNNHTVKEISTALKISLDRD